MITDQELLARLSSLSRSQAESECEIIAYLIEVERRQLHLKKAYSSLFEFVRSYLKCSEATAGRRIAVVRVATKYPVALCYLRKQKLTLSAIAMIASRVTQENHRSLLDSLVGLSTRDIERLLARTDSTLARSKRDIIRPIAQMHGQVDRLAAAKNHLTLSAESGDKKKNENCAHKNCAVHVNTQAKALGELLPMNDHRAEYHTQSDKVRMAFDAPATLATKIERLKEIHAHKLKKGSLAGILEMAVDCFLDRSEPDRKVKKSTAKARAVRVAQPQAGGIQPRTASAAMRRDVWRRDEGRCTYTDERGRRCAAKSYLQLDHIQPWALGGSSYDAGNLRLLCRAHNLFMARTYFPAQVMRSLERNSRNTS